MFKVLFVARIIGSVTEEFDDPVDCSARDTTRYKTFRVVRDWPCCVDDENNSGRKFHSRKLAPGIPNLSDRIEGARACYNRGSTSGYGPVRVATASPEDRLHLSSLYRRWTFLCRHETARNATRMQRACDQGVARDSLRFALTKVADQKIVRYFGSL